MATTNIEWATHSINPIKVKGGGWHCTKVSPGCQNCYAEGVNNRFGNKIPYDNRHVEFELDLGCFDKLPKKKPAIVFVQSMGDLFHEGVPFEFIDKVYSLIALNPLHKFLVLTKRPQRLLEYYKQWSGQNHRTIWIPDNYDNLFLQPWPFPNLWLGVTAENQEMADKRIPILLQIPAAVRFVSIEPMLGPVSLSPKYICDPNACAEPPCLIAEVPCPYPKLDWIILGAESGPKRRYCDPEWMIDVVKQCDEAGVPMFVKQIHQYAKDKKGLIVSKNMSEWPAELQHREMPG